MLLFIGSNPLNLFSCLWSIEFGAFQITVAFDETTTLEDVDNLFKVFSNGKHVSFVTYAMFIIVNFIITHYCNI